MIRRWFCDTCGQPIEKPEDGMLQWLGRSVKDRLVYQDLRIVHHLTASPLGGERGCYLNRELAFQKDGWGLGDSHLKDMVGPDGLVDLLLKLEDKKLPVSEVNRVIMRLFVPNYEEARPYFEQAFAEGIIERNSPEGYFSQSELSKIIENIPHLIERS